MLELIGALNLVFKYEIMEIEELVKEFSAYTKQDIPAEVIQKFRLSGLSNIDFLCSDFLNQFGFKNLLQHV